MTSRRARIAGVAITASLVAFATSARAGDDPCPQQRPTDPSGYAGYVYDVTASSFDTPEGNGRVWYAPSGKHAPPLKSTRADGVPDAVASVGQILEEALAHYATMGYVPPLRDGDYPTCASNGGDGRIDVYMVAFTGADGLTVSERCKTGATTTCPGFLLVDHGFTGRGYKSFVEGAKTVVPHELFHLIQNAYDAQTDRFWAEGSAQWADKQVYPEIIDLERFLPEFFSQVERPLDAPAGGAVAGYLYGSAIWPVFLTERHGPDVIKKIFEASATGSGPVLDHTDAVLAEQKTTLADEFGTFVTWNAATGKYAGTGGYASAASYPSIPAPKDFPDGIPAQTTGVTAGFSARYFALHDPAPRKISLTADETRLGGIVLPLEDGHARVDRATPLPTTIAGEAIVILAGRSSKKTDVNYVLAAAAPDPESDAGADGGTDGGAPPGDGGGGSGGGCAMGASSDRAPIGSIALALILGALVRRRR